MTPVGELYLVQYGLTRGQKCGGGAGWFTLTALNFHRDGLGLGLMGDPSH